MPAKWEARGSRLLAGNVWHVHWRKPQPSHPPTTPMHLLHAPPPSKLQPLHIDREQSREVVPTTAVIDKYTGEEVQKAEIKLYYPKDSATRIPKVGGWVGGWVGGGGGGGEGGWE